VIYVIVLRAQHGSEEVTGAELLAAVLLVFTYFLLVVFVYLQRSFGYVNGGAIWFYLLLQIVATALSIPTYKQFPDERSSAEFVLIYIAFAIQILLLFTNSIADRVPNLAELMTSDSLYGRVSSQKQENPSEKKIICPKETASFPSKLTFWWFNSIAWKGYRQPLVMDDLWQIRIADRCSNLFRRFNEFWGHSSFTEPTEFLPDSSHSPQDYLPSRISVFFMLARQFWPYFLFPSLARLVTDLLQLLNPTIMK